MGAIARSAANLVTTSGVWLKGGVNNASMDSITTLPSAAGADGITFISSQTASNSSSITFTSGITSTYKIYKFVFSNIYARTDSNGFMLNLSTDSGSNYNVTKTSHYFRAYATENNSGTALTSENNHDLNSSTSDDPITVNGDLGNGSDESVSGSMLLFNPASTTYVKHYISRVNYYHASNLTVDSHKAGFGDTTSAINAVRFRMSSGNMDGTIYMYGIK